MKHSRSGFTLVELLIVVAIIGVFATVGVPTFRTMVQKAKKSEAKVNLGGIYTSETAFFSEYGTYGSNLAGIGFTTDGGNSRVYTIGFVVVGCTGGGILPPVANFPALNTAFPGYYRMANGTSFFPAVGGFGVPAGDCVAGAATTSQFLAGAIGFISGAAGATTDQWSINEGRVLANVREGMR